MLACAVCAARCRPVSGAASGLEEFDVFVIGQQEEFFGQS